MPWLALHLPLLSLEAYCAPLDAAHKARPAVLLQEHRVSHVNPAAAACGVRPGMKRATALALSGELLIAEACARRDAAALLAVAHAALAYTPAVCLQDAQTVLLDVHASLRLFGGLQALWRGLLAATTPLGHRMHSAAAPTPLGAALLSRSRGLVGCSPASDPDTAAAAATAEVAMPGPCARDLAELQSRLDPAPVWLLGPGRVHGQALQGMGLHTVADLRRMPRAGLVRRFGAAVLDELDRALALQPDPRSWLELPAVFDTRLELQARAEHAEQVLAGADVLLARLVAWAQGRHARVAAFTLSMLHERNRQAENPPTRLRVELAEPALDAAHLQLLLRERLARLELAAPTLSLQLVCRDAVQAPAPNGELFPTRASQREGLLRLLERLSARLGESQVQRLVAVADHRPECARRFEPAQADARSAAATAAAQLQAAPASAGLPLTRPAWLLPQPRPLAERGALPLLEGRPLQLVSGPERIEAGWWDGQPVARDYFIAMTDDGALIWIYRGRLPATEPQPQAQPQAHWFLQGRFA